MIRFNETSKLFLCIFVCLKSISVFSQITITEINASEDKVVLQPPQFDSLNNWQYFDKVSDYKQYIGLQIFLAPQINGTLKSDYKIVKPFLFTSDIKFIKSNIKTGYNFTSYDVNGGSTLKEIIYDSIATNIYKPFHYYSVPYGNPGARYPDDVKICSDSSKISNNYFTILNVLYGQKIDSLQESVTNSYKVLNKMEKSNLFISSRLIGFGKFEQVIYLIRNDKTGDSIYCSDIKPFILVPYFTKQNELYKNKVMLYTGEQGYYGDHKRIEYDLRFVQNVEDDQGDIKETKRQVVLDQNSKWTCIDVTLLKPTYELTYILKNDKDEQITIKKLDGFVREIDFIKAENEKRMKQDSLIRKQNQEKLLREENERKAFEIRKSDCTNKFGEENGILIANHKVRIGMTMEMCKYAWGSPIWTNKTTTEYGTYENWYYWLGFSLHFTNGVLKRIEE